MSSQIDSPQWIHKTCKVLYNSAFNFQKYRAKFSKKCHRDRLRKRKRLWLRRQRNPALMKKVWFCENEMISMSRTWDKEKIWDPDRIRTYDLPNTGRALYPLELRRTHRFIFDMCPAYWHCMMKEWIMVNFKVGCHERGTKKKSEFLIKGSNPVGDSDFFFVPRSWHADHFVFTFVSPSWKITIFHSFTNV